MTKQNNYQWAPGNWKELVSSNHLQDLGVIPYKDIGAPYALNIHCHLNYDRLFWSVKNEGLKTPLLLRKWKFPFRVNRFVKGCKADGNRADLTPSIPHEETPKYELVLGNMRWCAAYICGYDLPCLILPEDEQDWVVEDLWEKYHPSFEGGWYDYLNRDKV